MADVKERPAEAGGDSGAHRGGDSAAHEGARVDKRFKTVSEASRDLERERDPKAQAEAANRRVQDGATQAAYKDVGGGADIYSSPVIKASLESGKLKDPSARMVGNTLSFEGPESGGKLNVAALSGGDKLATAGSVGLRDSARQGDRAAEISNPADKSNRPGDNNVREIDPSKDNPQAVQQRYEQMVDGLGLRPEEAARMKTQFDKDMSTNQEKFKGDDLSRVMRSMNLMMDQNNHLQNDSNRVNAVAGLAARGSAPADANRQGANPTCALTSQSRIEQERDFVKYADQMGSVAAKGGAWRGGENGSPRVWVDVDAAGTNHANFTADAESKNMYNPAYHQSGGHRDYLGQIDNALVGGEMAKYAGQRDHKDYVYITANAQRAGAAVGQGEGGGALMQRTAGDSLRQVNDDGKPASTPPSTLDMVAKVNQANGGGGLMIQENLAREFRRSDGSYPPGMNVFKDAADLRSQLASHPGQEYQIATNGIMVAGKAGHGLHAQTVSLNSKGQLEFGNNWDDAHNHKVYTDDFVNAFTDKNQWDNYRPQHVMPDGHSPDWKREIVGPSTRHVVDGRSDPNGGKSGEDQKNKEDQKKKEEEKLSKDQKNKEQKDKNLQEFNKQHDAWKARKDSWEAKNPGKEFMEKEPSLSTAD